MKGKGFRRWSWNSGRLFRLSDMGVIESDGSLELFRVLIGGKVAL